MDLNRIIKWVVIIAIAIAVWKFGIPWVKQQNFGGTSTTSTGKSGGDSSCVKTAEDASSALGSGIGRFVNPPYDLNAWSSFRSDVDSKISSAESACSCADESCQKVREAMRDLRGIVSELDSSIRTGGSPPEQLVQRQERIDNLLNEAGDLVRAGK
jgi:hypothetical protein